MTTEERLEVLLSGLPESGALPAEYKTMICADAEQVICHLRVTDTIEEKYVPVAARLAFYWCEKYGFNGATSMSENGISRVYETGDVPPSIIGQVTPAAVAL